MCGPLLALGITPSPTATFNPILEGGRREHKTLYRVKSLSKLDNSNLSLVIAKLNSSWESNLLELNFDTGMLLLPLYPGS